MSVFTELVHSARGDSPLNINLHKLPCTKFVLCS